MNGHRFSALVGLALLAAPGGAGAQKPTARQVDSLDKEIGLLKPGLDSVRAALAGGKPAAAVDTGAADDLAALRAAAAAAAGPASRDTAPVRFVGRERNQAQLHPEISVTGDVRAYTQMPGVQRDNFDPREFEIGFQSALDPYSHTKIFVSLENGNVSIEEGYAYWTGLPGHVRFDIGKFRQQFGELNRWHLHAVPETEYPLALTTYLGGDGLAASPRGSGGSGAPPGGGYGTPPYKLGQRWIAGVRYDYVEAPPPAAGLITRQLVPSLTLWESEWVMLRAQYRREWTASLPASNQLAFQAVWAIGPHKHEIY